MSSRSVRLLLPRSMSVLMMMLLLLISAYSPDGVLLVESWVLASSSAPTMSGSRSSRSTKPKKDTTTTTSSNICSSITPLTLSSNNPRANRFAVIVQLLQAESSSSSSSDTAATSSISTPIITPLTRPPRAGDVVTLDCRLVPVDFVPEPLIDGIVLHADDPAVRLQFVLGGGNYLPGLHELVLSEQMAMHPGETVHNISLDAGWGARHPNLVATLTYEAAGVLDAAQIRVGMQLHLSNGLQAVVTATTDADFTIDANPPLAGASYAATVTLVAVEEGPIIKPYQDQPTTGNDDTTTALSRYQVATFALGCFWGAELEFMRVPGVVGTAVGYTQGTVADPTYEQVCSGSTGHTEAVAVTFDPAVVSYHDLVHLALDRLGENKYLINQVGNDKGTQYRHGVYYHTPEQKAVAEAVLAHYGEDCVTECLPATAWYAAEDHHQQYLLKGGQSARKGDSTAIRCYG